MLEEVSKSRASILVVDDNPLMLNVISNLLNSVNYEVYTSSNGVEAYEFLLSNSVDVIICDVMMPKMDGFTLHDRIRSSEELWHVPFIFLTALGEDHDVNRGLESGADDYLIKPFEPTNLLSVVKGKIARSRALKAQREKLYDAYRKKVLHTLSHELRTPLVAINTGAELLMQKQAVANASAEGGHFTSNPDILLSQQKMLLEAIARGGQRLESLVNDFILLQQIDVGVASKLFQERARPCCIFNLLHCFVESCKEELEADGFSITFCSSLPVGVKAMVYEPQIIEILKKLLDNARKFSRDEKHLNLSLEHANEDELRISLQDKGIGFDKQAVSEALALFGQIGRAKLEQQGSGLGLAICKSYAEIHKGRIELDCVENGGSTASLLLPALR